MSTQVCRFLPFTRSCPSRIRERRDVRYSSPMPVRDDKCGGLASDRLPVAPRIQCAMRQHPDTSHGNCRGHVRHHRTSLPGMPRRQCPFRLGRIRRVASGSHDPSAGVGHYARPVAVTWNFQTGSELAQTHPCMKKDFCREYLRGTSPLHCVTKQLISNKSLP
jgi:hypothetical protein